MKKIRCGRNERIIVELSKRMNHIRPKRKCLICMAITLFE